MSVSFTIKNTGPGFLRVERSGDADKSTSTRDVLFVNEEKVYNLYVWNTVTITELGPDYNDQSEPIGG